MRVEVKAPELSESVQSGTLLEWRRQPGEAVKRDEPLADLETDKVILEVTAPVDGVLSSIAVAAGAEVKAGDVLAEIETGLGAEAPVPQAESPAAQAEAPGAATEPTAAEVKPPPQGKAAPAAAVEAVPETAAAAEAATLPAPTPEAPAQAASAAGLPTESAAAPAETPVCPPCPPCPPCEPARVERRVQMSRLRQRIAERMVEAQHTAAILTTFNEIGMSPVQELRRRHQERFQEEHGVKLGLMSFFVKAVCLALKAYPLVNAYVDGRDIVYHDFYDIGIAVSSERGLVVPILRNADDLSFAEIEQAIAEFARRANKLELTIEELEGGTFTISNGGIFGSLLSTPILNPPQSGILGLHKIQDRPIALKGEVVIRPMMYVALSYDHRIVDGREAVSFLRAVKDALEDPASLLLEL